MSAAIRKKCKAEGIEYKEGMSYGDLNAALKKKREDEAEAEVAKLEAAEKAKAEKAANGGANFFGQGVHKVHSIGERMYGLYERALLVMIALGIGYSLAGGNVANALLARGI